jgi:hypothetical protein
LKKEKRRSGVRGDNGDGYCVPQAAGAESGFRNNFFGKQIDSSQLLIEDLEICFPKKLFLKFRRKAAAGRLLSPLSPRSPYPFLFFKFNWHEQLVALPLCLCAFVSNTSSSWVFAASCDLR